jgi:hypothetical protein
MPPRHHHRHPPHAHPHEETFLKALELLVKSGIVGTVEGLIRVVEQMDEPAAPAAAQLLRTRVNGCSRPDLALDLVRAELLISAEGRHGALIQRCANSRIGLVLPLPPHVIDVFSQIEGTTLLLPSGQGLPPHLSEQSRAIVRGSRACRQAVVGLGVLVFEADIRPHGEYGADPDVADVVDPRVIPPNVLLVVHRRPHGHPEDVPLLLEASRVAIL